MNVLVSARNQLRFSFCEFCVKLVNAFLTGVEEAFCASTRVMTISVHKYSPGFFPGMFTKKVSEVA